MQTSVPLLSLLALTLSEIAVARDPGADNPQQRRQESYEALVLEESKLLAAVGQYRDEFEMATRQLLAERQTDARELNRLRAQITRLQGQEELTKELIAKVQPKLQRLEQLLMIDRQAVHRQAPELLEKRAALARKFQPWDNALTSWNGLSKAPHETLTARPTKESLLVWQEHLAIQLAVVADDSRRTILKGNSRFAARLDPEEAKCVHLINQLRILLGRRPVKIDLALCFASRDHAHCMRTQDFFSHESPIEGKKLPVDRAKHFGTVANAENIAWGFRDAQATFTIWFHSPPHLTNMIARQHRRIGIGRSEAFWTLMLGSSLGW